MPSSFSEVTLQPPTIPVQELSSESQTYEKAVTNLLNFLDRTNRLDTFDYFTLSLLKALANAGHVEVVFERVLNASPGSVSEKIDFLCTYRYQLSKTLVERAAEWLLLEPVQNHLVAEMHNRGINGALKGRPDSQIMNIDTLFATLLYRNHDSLIHLIDKLPHKHLLRNTLVSISILDFNLVKDWLQIGDGPPSPSAESKPTHWQVWKDNCEQLIKHYSHAYDSSEENDNSSLLDRGDTETFYAYLAKHPFSANELINMDAPELFAYIDPESLLWLFANRPHEMIRRAAILSLSESLVDQGYKDQIITILQAQPYANLPVVQEFLANQEFLSGNPQPAIELLKTISIQNPGFNLISNLIKAGYTEPVFEAMMRNIPQLDKFGYSYFFSRCMNELMPALPLDQQKRMLQEIFTYPVAFDHFFSNRPLDIIMVLPTELIPEIWAGIQKLDPYEASEGVIRSILAYCYQGQPDLQPEITTFIKTLYPQFLDNGVTSTQTIKSILDNRDELTGHITDNYEHTNEELELLETNYHLNHDTEMATQLSQLIASTQRIENQLHAFLKERTIDELEFIYRLTEDQNLLLLLKSKNVLPINLSKTGSEASVWNNGIVTNKIKASPFHFWQLAHRTNVPVAPIIRYRPNITGDVIRVRSRYCGPSLAMTLKDMSLQWPASFLWEVDTQKVAIALQLKQLGITHGHPHDGNFTVEFVRKEYYRQHKDQINDMPYHPQQVSFDPIEYLIDTEQWQIVVRLIDWDQARSDEQDKKPS